MNTSTASSTLHGNRDREHAPRTSRRVTPSPQVRPHSVDIDASRLLPRYRADAALRQQQRTALQRQAEAAYVEDRTVTMPTRTALPAPGELRGIPAIGMGVGGVIPGTQPEQACVRKMGREAA